MAKKSFWNSPSRYGTYEGERGNPAQWANLFKCTLDSSDAIKILKGQTAQQVLGVSSNPSEVEVKNAYRKLVKIHHPDKANGNREKFDQVQAAYAVLTNSSITIDIQHDFVQPTSTDEIIPQLLTEISKDEVDRYLDDDNYCIQEKKDGRHLTLQIKDNNFFVRNKKGKASTFAPEFENDLRDIGNDLLIDGEQIGNTFYTWDILEFDGHDFRNLPYRQRFSNLETLQFNPSIKIVSYIVGRQDKRNFFNKIKNMGKEGVVFKNLNAPFTPGKGTDQLKFKFYHDASIIVVAGRPNKNSIGMELIDNSGNRIHVGYCTCVLHPLPPIDSIADVKYLYAYRGGCLYQTAFKTLRDDVDLEECTTSQLHYKFEE